MMRSALLWDIAQCIGNFLSTFRDDLSVQSSKVKKFKNLVLDLFVVLLSWFDWLCVVLVGLVVCCPGCIGCLLSWFDWLCVVLVGLTVCCPGWIDCLLSWLDWLSVVLVGLAVCCPGLIVCLLFWLDWLSVVLVGLAVCSPGWIVPVALLRRLPVVLVGLDSFA